MGAIDRAALRAETVASLERLVNAVEDLFESPPYPMITLLDLQRVHDALVQLRGPTHDPHDWKWTLED